MLRERLGEEKGRGRKGEDSMERGESGRERDRSATSAGEASKSVNAPFTLAGVESFLVTSWINPCAAHNVVNCWKEEGSASLREGLWRRTVLAPAVSTRSAGKRRWLH